MERRGGETRSGGKIGIKGMKRKTRKTRKETRGGRKVKSVNKDVGERKGRWERVRTLGKKGGG